MKVTDLLVSVLKSFQKKAAHFRLSNLIKKLPAGSNSSTKPNINFLDCLVLR